MKRRAAVGVATLAVGLALAAVVAAGTGGGGGGGGTVLAGTRVALPTGLPGVDLGAADTSFGLDLLRTACAAAPSANQLLSPLSTSGALDLVDAGARGTSATALAATLHQPAYGPALEAALAVRGATLARLDGTHDGPALQTSDRAFLQQGYGVSGSWLTDIATAQDAQARALDFAHSPESSRAAVNRVVSGDTGGHIAHLLPPGTVDPLTRLVLTAALHLTATWSTPFDSAGSPQAFTTAAGPTVQTPYLTTGRMLGYAADSGWQAVAIPFTGDRLQAVALLPPPGSTGCTLPEPATLARLAPVTEAPVELSIPPLKLDVRTDLTMALKQLGLAPVFGDSADLSGIAGVPGDLRVQAVQHEATLALDRGGVEASAATAVEVRAGGAVAERGTPETVTLNRPWLIEIEDTMTHEPLFLGRIADPTAS